ncbi:MAG: ankyrin repeat domain-containing protein [Candidatus Endonucleobacter bathymodioli]|uniref:Ankyrin repeat domain-containing protein n=1 Tax=Candidatus Endonucleibacter bathymodioli TaxID=539814 RepID=A0AA90SYQ9_9GAMM|nr:ankyrin repeat domain-containing protein [Candidatus Endonucleobacter bathymodioli]
MFCALLKCSVRSCHLIYVLLFCSIVTGIYSGVCCAVLRIDSNSFDGAYVIDSVDESNSIVHDGDVQDDSSTCENFSILSIVDDMDDSALLNAMLCLLNIAQKHNDDDLIKALQLSEMSNYASKENDVTALQGADSNHDYVIKFLRDNIHTAPYESEGGLLTCAIPFGNNKLIELLIESGAKVNSLNVDQYMPLHKAVRSGEIEIVKILLNAGADVNHECLSIHILTDPDSSFLKTFCAISDALITPLQLAIACDDFEIIKVLINRKANPNYCIKGKYTPVQMAVSANSNNILTALLSAGAEANIEIPQYASILHYAVCIFSSPEIIETIIRNVKSNIINMESIVNDTTPLGMAILDVSNDLVRVLINNGANPNYSNLGRRPLSSAAHRLNRERDNGKVINSKNIDIFECLLSAGAYINHQNKHGVTALMIIVHKQYYLNDKDAIKQIISMLLSNGADINMIDKRGNTALHYAAEHGHSDFAALLLDYGAKRDIKNCDGLTAVELAISDEISTMISNAQFVAMQPDRMKTIVRNSIRSRLIENRTEKQSLSKMISALGLPEIIRDSLRNPM